MMAQKIPHRKYEIEKYVMGYLPYIKYLFFHMFLQNYTPEQKKNNCLHIVYVMPRRRVL